MVRENFGRTTKSCAKSNRGYDVVELKNVIEVVYTSGLERADEIQEEKYALAAERRKI